MHISLTGLNHRTAPLSVRERLSLTRAQVPGALETVKAYTGRGVVLSTCNRTELYTILPEGRHSQEAVDGFFEAQFGDGFREARPYLYTFDQRDAVKHLFRVTSGLDSLIIGESEVLGQVREAYSTATSHGAAGGLLTRLFHTALRVGKRARAETAVGRNALSVSRACVEMVRRVLGELPTRRTLVVGVGDASQLAAQALRDAGVQWLTVTNRTLDHADDLAGQLDAVVAPITKLPSLLHEADIVVTATGALDYILDESLVQEAMAGRADRPLFIMDMAVPRDVDPEVGALEGVHLYDLEHLEMIAATNRLEREAEAQKVERIVDEEVARFQQWWTAQEVTPTIAGIRHHAESLRIVELNRTLRSLRHLAAGDQERVASLSKALVKKLLHQPTLSLRARCDAGYTQVVRDLFGLDHPDTEQDKPGDGD